MNTAIDFFDQPAVEMPAAIVEPVTDHQPGQQVTGLPCAGCGGQEYASSLGGFDYGDGGPLVDGWECKNCGSVFLRCGHSEPGITQGTDPKGDFSASVSELAGLMTESGIRIKVWDHGQGLSVDWRGNDNWVTSNRDKASRLEDLIYRLEPTVSLLALLPVGIWLGPSLLWFGGVTPKRERGGDNRG